MSLIAKISIHSQQICGLAWSPNGKLFASGGNDDLCCLFEVDAILDRSTQTNTIVPVRQWPAVPSPDISNDHEQSFQMEYDTVADAQNPERGRQGARIAAIGNLAENGMSPIDEGTGIRGMNPAADGLRSLTHGCERHC
jgi:WD40 repeat protein